MTHLTSALPVADLWIERLSFQTRRWASPAILFIGSLVIALSAQISFRLPFSPVPVTTQTLAVLAIGGLLGARRGMLCVGLYLLEGIAGLPVFSEGKLGLLHLAGPTGGYLVGFIFAAGLTGWISERGLDRKWRLILPAFLAAHVVIFFFGVSWLSLFVGSQAALDMGYVPFIPGELLKSALAAGILFSSRKTFSKK